MNTHTAVLLLVTAGCGLARGGELVRLQTPAGPGAVVAVTDLSAHGQTAVGWVYRDDRDVAAVMWNAAGEATELSDGSFDVFATGVSNSGRVVLTSRPPGVSEEALVREPGAAPQPLPGLPRNEPFAAHSANAITPDGRYIAGQAFPSVSGIRSEAYRWSENGEVIGLGDLPGGQDLSSAAAITPDGRVVVGRSIPGDASDEAFRWTAETGLVGLGHLPDAFLPYSAASGVSGDGEIVIGGAAGDEGFEAFRWTDAEGMIGLGTLPGYVQSQASAISSGGEAIVGTAMDGFTPAVTLVDLTAVFTPRLPDRAVLWIGTAGARDLRSHLMANHGLAGSLADVELNWSGDLSADGRTLVVGGRGAGGERGVWYARLDQPLWVPEPATMLLAVLAMGVAAFTRRGTS